MKLVFAVLILFLLAFTGLSAGVLMKRRGLRSACGHKKNSQHDCKCEAELDRGLQGQAACPPGGREPCRQQPSEHHE
ncbi:MAG: hypothetical protein GW875_01165 [Deltaproteobacteria bacterium]|nr:hypothetical protein [Deltaproteobacteria bacterium]NCP02118.1 hypothetical protein [Deltaproteobacteria bacterium]NCP77714.1 hypothetical protein [Desulfuromonadales bacterium]